MSRARALRKARAEGKLTGEWEAMLDDLLGIDGQQRYGREAEGDVNPDTGDATFSLKAHQKTGLKEVIASANAAGNARSWAELPLPQDQRLAVESETGGSLQDFIRAVDTFGIRHASSRHGEESKDPHPITQADLLALPEILVAPGVMGLSPESGKNVSSVVHVRFHHDWYYYIEEVRTGSKALVFNTLRKSPGKAASSQTNSAEAGSYTSETILAEAKERLARALADYKQKHSGTHSLRAIPPGEATAEGGTVESGHSKHFIQAAIEAIIRHLYEILGRPANSGGNGEKSRTSVGHERRGARSVGEDAQPDPGGVAGDSSTSVTHSLALSDRLDALSVTLGEQTKTKPQARLALIARAQDRLLAAKAESMRDNNICLVRQSRSATTEPARPQPRAGQ